jgi:predicted  nucleic acid-binding Zn-ribbon protein
MNLQEEKKNLEEQITTAEQTIESCKENIKDARAKLRKLEKLEKEFEAIFGSSEEIAQEDENDEGELPGQTEMNIAS